MRHRLLLAVAFLLSACHKAPTDAQIKEKAQKLAHEFIIVDTHIDVPDRLRHRWEDVSQRTPEGNFDYPRAVEGGLNAPFMSIYTPADEEAKPSEMLLVRMPVGTARAFVERTRQVVRSGRPVCPRCGEPIDDDGHVCGAPAP